MTQIFLTIFFTQLDKLDDAFYKIAKNQIDRVSKFLDTRMSNLWRIGTEWKEETTEVLVFRKRERFKKVYQERPHLFKNGYLSLVSSC